MWGSGHNALFTTWDSDKLFCSSTVRDNLRVSLATSLYTALNAVECLSMAIQNQEARVHVPLRTGRPFFIIRHRVLVNFASHPLSHSWSTEYRDPEARDTHKCGSLASLDT